MKRVPIPFDLPKAVGSIASAVGELQERFRHTALRFTPDGKFVGDLGEAIAVEMFGVELSQGKGIDGHWGEIPVQIKATGRVKGGAVFRSVDDTHPLNTQLIVYFIDWTKGKGELIYNGPENAVRPDCRGGQRQASRFKLLTTPLPNDAFELPIRDDFSSRYIA